MKGDGRVDGKTDSFSFGLYILYNLSIYFLVSVFIF